MKKSSRVRYVGAAVLQGGSLLAAAEEVMSPDKLNAGSGSG